MHDGETVVRAAVVIFGGKTNLDEICGVGAASFWVGFVAAGRTGWHVGAARVNVGAFVADVFVPVWSFVFVL